MTDTFTCTSSAPYDRHIYHLHLKNGEVINFDCYENLQGYWFTHNQIPDYLDFVEVLDKVKSKKNKNRKGFG
jgi:hypothetical protein